MTWIRRFGVMPVADLTHLAGRAAGEPATDPVHEGHHRAAAHVLVEALAAGDEGAAARHLAALRHDPASRIDPWVLAGHAARLALRRGRST